MKRAIMILLSACLLLAPLAACGPQTGAPEADGGKTDSTYTGPEEVVEAAAGYGVSSSHYLATEVGMAVLESGGNAVDAAIAVAYTLGVVQPYASGIGGGGTMLLYDPQDDKVLSYNYLAASGVTQDIQVNDIGVPGFVAGMDRVHQDYGTMDMATLLQPAIDYATDGFVIGEDFDNRITFYDWVLNKTEAYVNEDGTLKGQGDTLIQEDLAETLTILQRDGAQAFYQGEIAQQIQTKTSLTEEDLTAYQVVVDEAVSGGFQGYTIYTSSAPTSGITLLQTLSLFEIMDLPDPGEDAGAFLYGLTTARSITLSQRYRYIGDPNFVEVDSGKLTSKSYVASLIGIEIEAFDEEEEDCTTHFVVMDADGMVVSCTNTLGNFYGSNEEIGGFYINDSLENFTEKGINSYDAGKVPRTFMSPVIVFGDDGYVMAIGTPGGRRIVQMTATVLWDILVAGTEPQQAVNKNRVVFMEESIVTVEKNDRREDFISASGSGYYIVPKENENIYFGAMQAIGTDGQYLFGASDPRRTGSFAIGER